MKFRVRKEEAERRLENTRGNLQRIGDILTEIGGQVPSLREKIVGCAFAGRCAFVTDLCREVPPAVEAKSPGHYAACHYTERAMAA